MLNLNITMDNSNGTNCEAKYVEEDIDMEKIRGDAIGNSMYSERFVLKTLLQLQDKEWNTEIENDLCTLWDMTVDEDVVDFLMKHDFVSLAVSLIIANIQNYRLVEILVGMISNLCVKKEILTRVVSDTYIMTILLQLIEFPDNETLIQLMRFINLACRLDNNLLLYEAINKSNNFIEVFSFLLNQNKQKDLLKSLLTTLQTLLYVEVERENKEHLKLFLNPQILNGIIICYQELKEPKDDFMKVSTDVENDLLFLDLISYVIQALSLNYNVDMYNLLKPLFIKSLDYIYDIISCLSDKDKLFPIDSVVITFIYETKSICEALKVFHSNIFFVILRIYMIIYDIEDQDELKVNLSEFIYNNFQLLNEETARELLFSMKDNKEELNTLKSLIASSDKKDCNVDIRNILHIFDSICKIK